MQINWEKSQAAIAADVIAAGPLPTAQLGKLVVETPPHWPWLHALTDDERAVWVQEVMLVWKPETAREFFAALLGVTLAGISSPAQE